VVKAGAGRRWPGRQRQVAAQSVRPVGCGGRQVCRRQAGGSGVVGFSAIRAAAERQLPPRRHGRRQRRRSRHAWLRTVVEVRHARLTVIT